MSPALFRSGGDRLHGVSHMPAPRSVFVVCTRVLAHGEKIQHGTLGPVAMTSAQHAEGRQFDPGRVYCLDVGTSARLGQDPDVRLLRSPQARPPVLTSRQQRCCSEPTPPADPSKIQMNQPAIPQLRGLMPQPSVRGACWVWVTRCTPDTCCAPSTQVWEFPGGAGNIRWSQEVARVTFLGSRM